MGYAHIIREDPVRRGLLYLGTENALYVSFDDGEQWQPLQLNLPHAPVYGMVIQEQFNDLVISTYGRGIFILDDLSPLQKLTPTVTASNATLFQPRAAYRFRDVQLNYTMSDDPTAGENPRYGADINYWLKAAPRSAPTIAISDSAGKTVRTIEGTSGAGINRVYWDLRNEPSKQPRLRTKPLWDEVFELGADGTRDAPGFGAISVQLAPGRYTVKLSVDGQSYSQPLEVRKDPHETISDAEMKAGIARLITMQGELNSAADAVNSMESIRVQLQALRTQLANDRANGDVRVRGDSLEQRVTALEGQIINLQETGRGQDGVRYGSQAAGQINYLAGEVAASDFAPTAQQRAVHTVLSATVKKNRADLDRFIQIDLAAFNALLRSKGMKEIVVSAIVF